MKFGHFSFGSIRIDDATYEHDVIVDSGNGPEAQEEAIAAISRRVRAQA